MPIQQTVYGSNNPPGGGNPFFAGLEEIFSSPKSAVSDAASSVGIGGGGTWVPEKNAAGGAQPGAGNSFLAGAEELWNDPGQFVGDANPLPNGLPTATIAIVVIGILGAAYIAHKVL